jgi:hypothetical protein
VYAEFTELLNGKKWYITNNRSTEVEHIGFGGMAFLGLWQRSYSAITFIKDMNWIIGFPCRNFKAHRKTL